MFAFAYLSIAFAYLSIAIAHGCICHLPICPAVYLSVYVCICHLPICLSIYLSMFGFAICNVDAIEVQCLSIVSFAFAICHLFLDLSIFAVAILNVYALEVQYPSIHLSACVLTEPPHVATSFHSSALVEVPQLLELTRTRQKCVCLRTFVLFFHKPSQ